MRKKKRKMDFFAHNTSIVNLYIYRPKIRPKIQRLFWLKRVIFIRNFANTADS